jgi:hypothetical protein
VSVVCIDFDKTISADPEFYKAECQGLRQRGHEVHVVSAVQTGKATNKDLVAKRAALQSLDFDEYDVLAVVDGPHKAIPKHKVAYMKHVGATQVIDNRRGTIRAARRAGFTGHWHANPKKKD